MELKDRKRIKNGLLKFAKGTESENNTGTAPGFANVMSIMNPIISGVQFVGSGIASGLNAYQNSDAIQQNNNMSVEYANGIAYEHGDDINQEQLMDDYKKDMRRSFLTNPFKGLTMLFQKRKQRRAIRQAAVENAAKNLTNMSGASSTYLQQNYALEYGNPQGLMLYAKNGKEAVETSTGLLKMKPVAKILGQEAIFNRKKLTARHIPGSPKTGDSHLAYLEPSDTVFTRNGGIADFYMPYIDSLEYANKHENTKNRGEIGKKTDRFVKQQTVPILEDGEKLQAFAKSIGLLPQPKLKGYKTGVEDFTTYSPFPINDPGLANIDRSLMKPLPVDYNTNYRNRKTRRFPSNWWIDGLGVLAHTGNLIADSLLKELRVKRSNTYRPNRFANNALATSAALNINPYPINKQLMDQERRNLYAINHMGGLSGAQKAYASIASGLGTLNSIASSNAKIQEQNNAYKSAYANAAINAGQADRQARMAANQWDLDYYSKAHAAKQQMIQQDIYNALTALQQGYKNSFDRYTFDNIMSRYTS